MTLNVPTDSYVSIEEANGYHQLRASFEAWNELDDEQKARRLVSASDFLDHNYRFVGEKAEPTQIRQFPRQESSQESSEIPLQVKYAVLPAETDNARIPLLMITSDTCIWQYRSAECGYTGGPVADEKDNPTTDPKKDACSHCLRGCKLRFGANAILPFGGFPSTTQYGA